WTSVFEGVPDFEGELVAWSRTGDTEWGEVDWRGHHLDGATFAMRGVIVATVVDDLITSARLYVEPVEQQETGDIEAAVEQLYRPPR
ncbi:MAG: nuclear transport factor 2 family protein, partial [Marmoricola sp.]|nr:nuclear transport factor 2 family protein [Marmoricola sp.]